MTDRRSPAPLRLSLLCVLLAVHEPAFAACAPADAARTSEQVAERIDHYRRAVREPGTYRALAGLGDPDAPAADYSPYYRNTAPEERSLLARMPPGQRGADTEYWFVEPGACRLDYALQVARRRVARLGRDHPYVEQWLRTQRAVFSACQGGNRWERMGEGEPAPRASLPVPMPIVDPPLAQLQRDDRAYQAASILFYRGDPAAARAFRAIAATVSPHAPVARYMTVAIEAQDVDADTWNEAPEARTRRVARARSALAGARAILAEPALAEVHPLAQGLIGYLGYWTGDERVRDTQVDVTMDALAAPLGRIAADPIARDRYSRAVSDIVWLRRDLPEEPYPDLESFAGSSAVRGLARRARRDLFAAWLIAPVSPFEREPWARPRRDYASLPHHELRQPGYRRHQPWALVGASFSHSYSPGGWAVTDELVRDTRICPSDERLAAIASLFYHQVRTALMYPAVDADWQPLAQQDGFRQALARVEAWPWRTSSHYRELVTDMLHYLAARGRLEEARTLRDRIAPRGGDERENAAALLLLAEDENQLVREVTAMPDAMQPLLNLLPVAALARLAERGDLPQPVRARFARTAWARLYALQRQIPRRLDRLMRGLNPEITAGWASRSGARPGNRALLLDVLRSPGLNILLTDHQRGGSGYWSYSDDPGLAAIDTFQHSDNNWWCAWQPDRHRLTASAIMYGAFFRPEDYDDWDSMAAAGTPEVLGPLLRASWLWQAQDPTEQAALARVPSAPRLLAERAVAWRGSGLFGRLSTEGQDEALALAVRATRYGCQRQGGHGDWSRAAFTLLHARFPGSDAASRTRYWFDCAHFTGGCAGRPEDFEPEWERWAGPNWWY